MNELLHVKQSTLPAISERMGHADATRHAKVLLGSYPREPHDPATFIAGIVQVLSEYPEDAGREAIDKLTRRLKHYPTRADLVEVLEEVMKPRRAAHAQARADAEAAKRRQDAAESEAKRQAERELLRAMLGDAWDAWWNIKPLRRFAGGTAAEFAKGWQAATDKQAFADSWGYGSELMAG